jgi:hypothetical protein
MTATLQTGTETQQPTGEQVVTTDTNYKLNKTDDKVIGKANITCTLPDNPRIGESHKFNADVGNITLAGGQFPLAYPLTVLQGNGLEVGFTGTKWVAECCEGHSSLACALAYDDDYIRSVMSLIELGVTATGGPAAAAAYAAIFCPDGCVDGNVGELFHICGQANILANNLAEQAFLNSLSFSKLQISRTLNPDNSVEVTIFRYQDLTLVAAPLVVLKSFGVTYLTFDPSCCLKSEYFVDLRPQCPCPPPPPPPP